jgi:hypothetical protein
VWPVVAPRGGAARAVIVPLALAQFIASYAATNMNVASSAIAKDLGTTVAGVQTAITLFTLVTAALPPPGPDSQAIGPPGQRLGGSWSPGCGDRVIG